MSAYNGAALPASLGPLPPKGDTPQGCDVVVAAGTLTVDAAGGRFAYGYDVRDACTQNRLSHLGASGLFAQRGRDLTFRVIRMIDTVAFTGTFAAGVVTVHSGADEDLQFK